MKGISAIEINKNTPGYADKKQIYLSTFHSAKGLEFYNAFIPSLTADKWPDPDKMDSAEDKTEVYAEELKLLYVAVTRSKFGLFILSDQKGTVVFSAQEQYLANDNVSEIIGGRFRILGKVISVCKSDTEEIDLLRKTSLRILSEELLSDMFSGLEGDSLKQFNLPKLKTKIHGPAVIVIPIAIYA